jgi:hypothetical protein
MYVVQQIIEQRHVAANKLAYSNGAKGWKDEQRCRSAAKSFCFPQTTEKIATRTP